MGKQLWTPEGGYLGRPPKGGIFRVGTPGLAFSFEHQRQQYPEHGQPGIGYFRGEMGGGVHVDVLLYRDESGNVVGILQHYSYDMPPYQRRGSVNVFVDPQRRRQGIGTSLLKAAGPRFKIDLLRQEFTPDGAFLANRFLRAFGG